MNKFIVSYASSTDSKSNYIVNKLSNQVQLGESEIALGSLEIPYSWDNITSELDNNSFKYEYSSVQYNVILPDGMYQISDINDYMHYVMKGNTHYTTVDGVDVYPINFYANATYLRVSFEIDSGYKLIIPNTKLTTTLGINAGTYTGSTSFNGQNLPEITKVQTVFVHCNLVDNKFQEYSNLLYSFVPDNGFGTTLMVKPSFPQWTPTKKGSQPNITVWFTDQNNKDIKINDKKITVTLLTRPVGYN